ncbi:hypothetical protein [Candidatus Tokpelaia sp.]|nr:hypothetical protein [Candidatus Tokpelaia sp.]
MPALFLFKQDKNANILMPLYRGIIFSLVGREQCRLPAYGN